MSLYKVQGFGLVLFITLSWTCFDGPLVSILHNAVCLVIFSNNAWGLSGTGVFILWSWNITLMWLLRTNLGVSQQQGVNTYIKHCNTVCMIIAYPWFCPQWKHYEVGPPTTNWKLISKWGISQIMTQAKRKRGRGRNWEKWSNLGIEELNSAQNKSHFS